MAEDSDMAAFVATSGGGDADGVTSAGGTCGDPQRAMRDMFGPTGVDQQVRSAISTCWSMMPPDRRNADAVAAEVRRIVERALANLQEDARAFGFAPPPAP